MFLLFSLLPYYGLMEIKLVLKELNQYVTKKKPFNLTSLNVP